MIRVVIDTNVVISAFLHAGSLPEAVINLAVSGNVHWIASQQILTEYAEVLQRPRFAIDPVNVTDAMNRIRASVSIVTPTVHVDATNDPDDNMFLECAQTGEANYIITGNLKHFPRTWKKSHIVTPREFIDVWTATTDDYR
jgi:putative PIN family toxin of toxin-antitoxin system